MKRILLAMLLFAATAAFSQSQLPGWNITVNGNFTNITGANTNNGWLTSEAVRVGADWSLRADQYVTIAPAGSIVLGKIEYRRLLSDFIKPNPYLNTTIVEPFFNAGAGEAHSTSNGAISAGRFAFGFGGGFDIAPTAGGMFTIRPLDVSYVRASMLTGGGAFIGNHLTLAAGLGLRFGTQATVTKNKAMRQSLRAKYHLDRD
jgi:hypothetical protein